MVSPQQPAYTFQPEFFEKVWGGKRIARECGLDAPTDRPIGEAWLLSDHPECESIVSSGPAHGATLQELIETFGKTFLGSKAKRTRSGRFPLLLKILDAEAVLSVQVHPDDALAIDLNEQDGGKTEMWYFINADNESYVTCGLKQPATPEEFAAACESGAVESLLKKISVKKGDAIYVPSRTVHGIGPGCLIVEMQQNSDITYRLYDWNRAGSDGMPRQLHLEKGMRVADLNSTATVTTVQTPIGSIGTDQRIATSPYFVSDFVFIHDSTEYTRDGMSFTVLLPISPELRLHVEGQTIDLPPWHATVLPAQGGPYDIIGNGSLIRYTVC